MMIMPKAQSLYTALYCLASLRLVQNALKVFPDFPPELMDVVRKTDPATVTQHGLYMRDLSRLSVNAERPDAEASQAMDAHTHSSELSGTIFMSGCALEEEQVHRLRPPCLV